MSMHRRVIRGRTYDRSKSKQVAEDEYERDGRKYWEQLYQTSGGAFFIVRLTAPESGSDDEDVDCDEQWEPLSRAEADEWFRDGVQITLHDESVFAPPEDAKAEDEEERTVALTVRVPSMLRDRLVRAADKEHLSMNAYILRCVDRCLEGPRESASGIANCKERVGALARS
jgi:HicB family